MAKKVLYYRNEHTDDFFNDRLKERPLPKKYKYIHKNPVWNLFSFVLYYIVALPILSVVDKFYYGLRFRGKTKLWRVKGGCFIYANHTQWVHDAYAPCWAAFPRKNYTMVNRGATSVAPLRGIVSLLGGVPTPGGPEHFRSFYDSLEKRIKEGSCITIYPEQHIWPWYTGIRNFPATTFAYPVYFNVPVFAMATTYRARWIFKKQRPKIDVTIGGPFYPDKSLPEKEARQKLRDQVYGFLCSEAYKPGNTAWYEYIKADDEAKES